MSKRDLAFVSATSDAELEPRTKRRKDTKSIENEDVTMDDATNTVVEGIAQANGVVNEEVKEQGLLLWQTVKDVVNKDGRLLSYEFMRLPSKRQYPDYYELIKRPISLDEVKKGIDHGTYSSLEQIKDDIVHCFTNAKKYNQKESAIWLDAKFLHKMTKKEYFKMIGAKDEDPADGADDEGGEKANEDKPDAEGAGDGVKKPKVPNLYRQLKGRLQKLVDRADESGRVLSTLFMELPSKKDYPTYYKEIKRPQSFENIFRRLKRKEYETSADFAADIELVFNNAFAFNQEHSAVWEDATILRNYFRQLMSDLPVPFALPEYVKPPRNNNKIKLKVSGGNQTSSPPGQSSTAQPAASSSFILRVPGGNEPAKPPVNSKAPQKSPNTGTAAAAPATQPQAASTPTYSNQLPHAPMTAQTYPIQPIQVTPRQPLPYQYTPPHYPNAPYQPPANNVPAAAPSTSQVITSAIPHIEAQSLTKSPSPSNHRPLKGVSLTTKPRGRPLKLDYRDGVKSWAMRLGQGEGAVSVADVRFLGDDEEEQGSEEETHDVEEAEEDAGDVEPISKNGKGKAKRGRGRPPKNPTRPMAITKTKVTRSTKPAPKATTPLKDSIKIRLNGSVVKGKEDHEGEWYVELRLGPNVLEVGEEGGMTWKVYMERVAAL